jgi:hypothetical protein
MHEGGGDLEPTNQSGRQGYDESNDAELAGIRWDPALPLDQMPVSFQARQETESGSKGKNIDVTSSLPFSDEAVS